MSKSLKVASHADVFYVESDAAPKPSPMKKLVAPQNRSQRVSNKAQTEYHNLVITAEVAEALKKLLRNA